MGINADGSMIPAARCDSTSFLMTSRIVAFVLCILGRPLNAMSVVILQCMLGGTFVSPVVNDGALHRSRYWYTSFCILVRYSGFPVIFAPNDMELSGEVGSVNNAFHSSVDPCS